MAAKITLARLLELADSPEWERMPAHSGSITLRRTTEHNTPDYVTDRQYPGRRYDRHTFLTFNLVASAQPGAGGGVVRGQVLHGDASAPWVRRMDHWIPQALALEVIEAATARVSEEPPPPPVERCEWFARCENDATHREEHPAFPGGVPACDRCVQIGRA